MTRKQQQEEVVGLAHIRAGEDNFTIDNLLLCTHTLLLTLQAPLQDSIVA
jgi:hypothetical protein